VRHANLSTVNILSRYILRESTIYFLLSLFAFTGVLLTIRMLRFAALIINKGVEASQIGLVFLAIVPTFLEVAIPMATLLGIMLAFARLSGDSEITVMRASGISLFHLARPVVLFGVLATILSLIVSIEFKPRGFQLLSKTLFDIARTRSTSGLNEGVFNKLGALTLYAEKVDYYSGALGNILIDDRRNSTERQIITASSGSIHSNSINQTITLTLESGVIHQLIDKKYVTTHFASNGLVMSADEIFESDKKKDPPSKELFLPDLKRAIAALQLQIAQAQNSGAAEPLISLGKENLTISAARKKLHRMRVELGSRFAMPCAALTLALIGMPLGILPSRTQKTWGAGLSIALGLLVFVAYYGLLTVASAISESIGIAPYGGQWIPNLALLALAVLFQWKIGSEQWHSLSQPIEQFLTDLISRARKLFSRSRT
jgi:lipopolysaccharide export system permease protein